jgi:hypothetical protein
MSGRLFQRRLDLAQIEPSDESVGTSPPDNRSNYFIRAIQRVAQPGRVMYNYK